MRKKVAKIILKEILKGNLKTREEIEKFKIKISREYKLNPFLKNSEILEIASKKEKEKVRNLLKVNPVRTLSGVSVIAVMSKPYPCPHGKCIYCPGGDTTPQSYVGNSPAIQRGIMFNYDPYKQVWNRLKQLEAVGHNNQKNEIIVMGGTFLAFPKNYQDYFITKIYQALNDYPRIFNPNKQTSLNYEQKKNEKAKHRCIGLTFETRPDVLPINEMLRYGSTRVEIGVQSIYNDVLKFVNRGHNIKDVINATKKARDAGFKILYHIMPGLPKSNLKRDFNMFKELFKNPNFRPDMLKIYPTLVMKGTKLYDMWKSGKYKPLTEKEAIKLLNKVMKIVPRWVRVMRVQRDVPTQFIDAGVKRPNLRQYIIKGNDIRAREVGLNYKVPEKVDILVESYEANDGIEYFISAEDVKNNLLLGFCRLRIGKIKIVRELHVYGESLNIKSKKKGIQHKGLGRRLLKKAEEIAKKGKLFIISGIGVREYYRKLGYRKEGYYMVKKL